MTIEQRLVHDCGTTEIPELAVWLLADGTLVNGSKEGRQRDIDHHEIGWYFKPSKLAAPGDAFIYIKKFMRRGNIRMGFSTAGACFEYLQTPTEAQLRTLMPRLRYRENRGMEICIGRSMPGKSTLWFRSCDAFLNHLYRYTRAHNYIHPSL